MNEVNRLESKIYKQKEQGKPTTYLDVFVGIGSVLPSPDESIRLLLATLICSLAHGSKFVMI
jgi:hypothetical protein